MVSPLPVSLITAKMADIGNMPPTATVLAILVDTGIGDNIPVYRITAKVAVMQGTRTEDNYRYLL